jgi:hypothetical protein
MLEKVFLENSSIALIPNFQNDEQNEGGQSLMARGVALGHKRPPFSDVEVSPLRLLLLHPLKTNPIVEKPLNPLGKAAMHKKMVIGFFGLLA